MDGNKLTNIEGNVQDDGIWGTISGINLTAISFPSQFDTTNLNGAPILMEQIYMALLKRIK